MQSAPLVNARPTVLPCVLAGSRLTSTPPRKRLAAPLDRRTLYQRREKSRTCTACREKETKRQHLTYTCSQAIAIAISLDLRAEARGEREDQEQLGQVLQDEACPGPAT